MVVRYGYNGTMEESKQGGFYPLPEKARYYAITVPLVGFLVSAALLMLVVVVPATFAAGHFYSRQYLRGIAIGCGSYVVGAFGAVSVHLLAQLTPSLGKLLQPSEPIGGIVLALLVYWIFVVRDAYTSTLRVAIRV